MVKRRIVQIDEAKCDGCGLCVPSCAEGAIRVVAGKAQLVSEIYCDGLGACLGHCPQGAISIGEREAEPFDARAAAEHLAAAQPPAGASAGGCPGGAAMPLRALSSAPPSARLREPEIAGEPAGEACWSGLANWPVQLSLVPPQAAYLRQADLLLVADCVPVACADFHRRFLDGRPALLGCPKLDDPHAHVRKLAQIAAIAGLKSITVLRMEVPCCAGLSRIAERAAQAAGVDLPLRHVTISIRGQVLSATQGPGPPLAADALPMRGAS